jgi:hypothetical protein
VSDLELINMALNGFVKYWEPFSKGLYSQENILDWNRHWDDIIQKETWGNSKAEKKDSRGF